MTNPVTFTATPTAGTYPLTVAFADTTVPDTQTLLLDTFQGTGTLATHVSNNGISYRNMYDTDQYLIDTIIVNNGIAYFDTQYEGYVLALPDYTPPASFTTTFKVGPNNNGNSNSTFNYYLLDNDYDWNGMYTEYEYVFGQWRAYLSVYWPTGYYDSGQLYTGITDPSPLNVKVEIINGSRFILTLNGTVFADSNELVGVPQLNLQTFEWDNYGNYWEPGNPIRTMNVQDLNVYTGSAGATAWLWNFGDGNTSTEQNPLYTYQTPGEYKVTLTATISGVDYTSAPQTITVAEKTSIAPVLNNLQFFDQQGNFLSGGKLYTYAAGASTTKQTTFADNSGTANPNPITLNEFGEPDTNFFGKVGANYNLIVTKPDGETVLEAVNGISTQQLIGGDHVFVETVDGISTVSAEKPDPTLGHGTTYLFSLSNDSEFAFHNVPFNDWNATTLHTETNPDVVWDNQLLFNTKGSYTVQVTTTITPDTTWPLKSTSFGVILQDPITDNPVQRTVHTRYMDEDNGIPTDLQTTTFYDEFTVSVAENTGLNLYVVAHNIPYSEYSAAVNVAVSVTKFSDSRYVENDPTPPEPIETIWLYDKFNGPAGEIDQFYPLGNIYTHTADTGQTYGKGYDDPTMLLNGLGASTVAYPWNSSVGDAWILQQVPSSNYWIEVDVYNPPNDNDSYLLVYFKIQYPSNPDYGAENSNFGCVGWAPVDAYYSSWIDWGLVGSGDVIDYSGNTACYPTPNGVSTDRNNGTHYYGNNKIRFEIIDQVAKVYVNGIFQYNIPLKAGCVTRKGYIGYGMRGRTEDNSDYMRIKAWRAGPLPVVPIPPTAVPVAAFTPLSTTGNTDVPPGLTVNFTDLSTNNPTSWHWDFGDGNTSTEQNPTHIYVTPRLDPYTVTMYCANAVGTSNTATGQVNAYGGINWNIRPVSSFTIAQINDAGSAQLTDTSTNNPDTWQWTITNPGGGTYPQQNLTHTFSPNASQYTVTLVASKAILNSIGVNPTSMTMYVNSKTQWKCDFSFAPNDPPYSVYLETDWFDTLAEAKANILYLINQHGNLYVKVNNGTWYVESTWYAPFQYNTYNGGISSASLVQYNSYFGTTSTYYYGTNGQSTQVSGSTGNYSRVKLDFSQ